MELKGFTVTSRIVSSLSNNASNTYSNLGQNHRGINEIGRIIMSLKSGLFDEIKWALSTLVKITMISKINFENIHYLGNKLISCFLEPYKSIVNGEYESVTFEKLNMSIDSLLTLRNLVQDLINQHWLSQIETFKDDVTIVLKFFYDWSFSDKYRTFELVKFENYFKESQKYLIDLLQSLCCYYIDNSVDDELFKYLLSFCLQTEDRSFFICSLKCLSNLLFVKEQTIKNVDVDGDKQEFDESSGFKTVNNCINAIKVTDLEYFINKLLICDNELSYSIILFLKTYLSSDALHPLYPNSIVQSQTYRLHLLVLLENGNQNFEILVKHLLLSIFSGLPINKYNFDDVLQPTFLSDRTVTFRDPSVLPEISNNLYNEIIRFDEPLRATTWLRCCYEPLNNFNTSNFDSNDADDLSLREVTQISLWKAYEKQFQKVWKNTNDNSTDVYKPLLPAVDFIKNVSNAFPKSEAVVINLTSEDNLPKKKFIIKGIQPRKHAVSIETGNYEAINFFYSNSQGLNPNQKLPIGHVDHTRFYNSLKKFSDSVIRNDFNLNKSNNMFTLMNSASYELLNYVINGLFYQENSSTYKAIFKKYNSDWILNLLYSNPYLLKNDIFNFKWLIFLV